MSASCGVDRGRHQVHDADSILAALGLDAADPSWRPDLPAGVRDEGAAALRVAGVEGKRSIGLAPSTARGDAKRWPARRFGELAARLRARGLEALIVIGPGEEAVADELCRAAKLELPVVGTDSDIAGLAAITTRLGVLVGNDSGPVQLASRLGIPVVAIFGPTDPGRTAPIGSRHRVVSPSPEGSDGIRGISVDKVEAAIIDLDGGG